jgi:hypothetical protein
MQSKTVTFCALFLYNYTFDCDRGHITVTRPLLRHIRTTSRFDKIDLRTVSCMSKRERNQGQNRFDKSTTMHEAETLEALTQEDFCMQSHFSG